MSYCLSQSYQYMRCGRITVPNSCEKTLALKSNQTAACQNYYLGMQATTFCIPSTSQNKRGSSLPNKIKIRTCKLPRDFFQAHTVPLLKGDSGLESRRSTCDDEASQPRTPSFKEHREYGHYSKQFRKAETARLIPAESPSHGGLVRQRSQSIRRKLSKQVSERFPILLLPPINISGRVFMAM